MRELVAKDNPPMLPKRSGKPNKMNPALFDELVSMLAEMLVLDFQAHTKSTVGSPPQTNRRFLPNAPLSLLQSAQQPTRLTDATVDRDPNPDKEAP